MQQQKHILLKRKSISVYDGKVLSAPNVQAEITDGKAVISGSFDTYESAEELASMILYRCTSGRT